MQWNRAGIEKRISTVRDTDQLEKIMTIIFSTQMNGTALMLRSCEILAAAYVLQCG